MLTMWKSSFLAEQSFDEKPQIVQRIKTGTIMFLILMPSIRLKQILYMYLVKFVYWNVFEPYDSNAPGGQTFRNPLVYEYIHKHTEALLISILYLVEVY